MNPPIRIIDLSEVDALTETSFVETAERFARSLHTSPDTSEAHRLIAFQHGISAFGGVIAGAWGSPSGDVHLLIDTPDFGNVWVVYRRAG